MEFKVGDRVRVCDGSADHWRTGVIDSIYAYSDVSNHLVLLDGEDECCGYSAHDLELIKSKFKVGDRVAPYNQPNSPGTITAPDPNTPGRWMVKFDGYDVSSSAEFTLVHYKPAPEKEPAFKVGDRVEVSNPNDFHYGCAGVVARIEQGSLYVVDLVDGLADTFLRTELRHLPTTHTRGTHPNSLANLVPGQERRDGEWEEKRLRLSTGACDWLRKQGGGICRGLWRG
jgi:hypothetical protein